MAELSVYGRLYNCGKAFGEDLKMKIILYIIGKGGDFTTGFFVGSFSAVAKENEMVTIEPTGNSEKSEPQMIFEPTTLRDLVGCSNH